MSEHAWRKFEVVCANCGESVIRNNPSKTCGLKCRDELRKKVAKSIAVIDVCSGCGEKNSLIYSASSTKVCSKRCIGIVFARTRRNRDWDKWRQEKSDRPVLGAHRNCAQCNDVFVVKRYDAKFCNTRCSDKWHHANGVKGDNLRQKNATKRLEKNIEIGSCSLCETKFQDLVSCDKLGLKRKNSKALFHLDHILPTSKGGPNTPENTRYLCWFCNLSRMDMDSKYDDSIAAAGAAFWKTLNK